MNLLAIYVFLIYSRVPEIIGTYVGALHIPMILMGILICGCFANGWPEKTFFTQPGLAQLAFTGWMLCCVPLSVWPGGSVQTIIFEWGPSIITFFVTAGLISNAGDSQRLTRSMALGVAAILVTYVVFGQNQTSSRAGTNIGTMGNPNMFALQLLMGMPFCLYPVYRSGISLKGLFYIGVLMATLYLVVSAGSRSGLIALGIGFLILLLRSSIVGKFGLLLMVVGGMLAAVVVLPRSTLDRYKTLFSDDPALAAGDSTVIAARDSAAARRYHLQQSINLTIQHPIFGVGPGQFRVAAADLSQKKNEHAAWLETHNSWTQVSSETGFPGLFCYVGGALYCIKRLTSQYRALRKNPQFADLADMTFCLLLSFIVTVVNMTFASFAYMPGLPLLCGLAAGLFRASEKAISEANQNPQGVLVQPAPLPAWTKNPAQHTSASATNLPRTERTRFFNE